MKRMVAGLSFLAALSSAVAQIPNASFESWSNGAPTDWIASNAPPVYTTITQVPTAHAGSSAVRGEVFVVEPLTFGPYLQSGAKGQGFPCSQRPTAFTGWYQMFPASGSSDVFFVNVVLKKNGSIPIAAGSVPFGASSTYKLFTVPLTYVSSESPDTCIIQAFIVNSGSARTTAGSYFLLDDLAFSFTPVSAIADRDDLPSTFVLDQNYPNPFNPRTTITFELGTSSTVDLTVFDLLGREMVTLARGPHSAGMHAVQWNARDNRGYKVPSGMYYYRLRVGGSESVRKMILLN